MAGNVDWTNVSLILIVLDLIHILISECLLISVVEPSKRRGTMTEADVRVEIGDGQLGRSCPWEAIAHESSLMLIDPMCVVRPWPCNGDSELKPLIESQRILNGDSKLNPLIEYQRILKQS